MTAYSGCPSNDLTVIVMKLLAVQGPLLKRAVSTPNYPMRFSLKPSCLCQSSSDTEGKADEDNPATSADGRSWTRAIVPRFLFDIRENPTGFQTAPVFSLSPHLTGTNNSAG